MDGGGGGERDAEKDEEPSSDQWRHLRLCVFKSLPKPWGEEEEVVVEKLSQWWDHFSRET